MPYSGIVPFVATSLKGRIFTVAFDRLGKVIAPQG